MISDDRPAETARDRPQPWLTGAPGQVALRPGRYPAPDDHHAEIESAFGS
jgi:hypothetical protein